MGYLGASLRRLASHCRGLGHLQHLTDEITKTIIAGGNGAGAATLEASLAFSYEIRHPLAVQPSSHIPRYLPK